MLLRVVVPVSRILYLSLLNMHRMFLVRCDVGLVISSDSSKTRHSFPEVRLTNLAMSPFQFAEHGGGEDEEYRLPVRFEVGILPCHRNCSLFMVEERYPCHIGGDGRSQYDDIPYLAEFEQVFGPMIHGGCLARTLLPVQQRVAFLQDEVQVVFLERGKLADLTVLVDECTCGPGIPSGLASSSHFRKLPVLHFVLPPFASYQFTARHGSAACSFL